jgi:hypothetical protein
VAKRQCYAQRHMSPAEYGFWDQCRKLAHGTGVLLFDGRTMAKRFKDERGSGYRTMYRLRDSLVETGWLVEVETQNHRKSDGTFEKKSYWVLSHEQWVTAHDESECRKSLWEEDEAAQPVTPTSLDTSSACDSNVTGPVTKSSPACDKTCIQPVTPASHRLKKTSLNINSMKIQIEAADPFSRTEEQIKMKAEVPAQAFGPQFENPAVVVGPFEYGPDPDNWRKLIWMAARSIGRGLTKEEIAEMKRRNENHVTPEQLLEMSR